MTDSPTPQSSNEQVDKILVKLIRFVEVYTDDEDISEADREGINIAKAAINALLELAKVEARIDEIGWAFQGSSEEEVSNSYWFDRVKTLTAQRQKLVEEGV